MYGTTSLLPVYRQIKQNSSNITQSRIYTVSTISCNIAKAGIGSTLQQPYIAVQARGFILHLMCMRSRAKEPPNKIVRSHSFDSTGPLWKLRYPRQRITKESTLNIVCPNVGIGAVSHHKLYAFLIHRRLHYALSEKCLFVKRTTCNQENV